MVRLDLTYIKGDNKYNKISNSFTMSNFIPVPIGIIMTMNLKKVNITRPVLLGYSFS